MPETYREASKKNWFPQDGAMTVERLQLGALQRIADAMEVMARHHAALIEERDRYKRWYEQEKATAQRLGRQVTALRGVITRTKRRAAAKENAHG